MAQENKGYFSIHLYGPKKAYLRGLSGQMVFIPSEKGMIEILPDHTHLITLLGTGPLIIDDQPVSYILSQGVCKILQKEIILLAKEVFVKEELKKQSIQEELDKILERMKSSIPLVPGEFDTLSLRQEKLRAQLSLFSS